MRPGKNLTLGSLLFVVTFAVGSLVLYGGAKLVEREDTAEAVVEEEEAHVPGGPTTIRLVARNLQFDKRSVSASAGGQVTVIFDNQDAAIHNVAFYTNNRATQEIFVGELFTGPASRQEQFTAPSAPGNYFFRCDAHPDTMNGTFTVR